MQFVRRCYGLRGIYGRFDSKIRFEIELDGRFDSRFDSNAKKRFAGPYLVYLFIILVGVSVVTSSVQTILTTTRKYYFWKYNSVGIY